MQAIEIETEIDENHEIHIKLPKEVQARKARVVVMYDEPSSEVQEQQPQERRPIKLGLFRGQIQMSDDFDEPLSDDFWLGGNP